MQRSPIKIFTFLILLLLASVSSAFSQGQLNESGSTAVPVFNLAPHSPEATALGKFGDIPVGLYTGVPNISVPIYQFKLKDLTVPVSIDYHSSGVKVDELATNVGLDWSLNAGGTINQIVYGLSDLSNDGWPFTPQKTQQTGLIQTMWTAIQGYNGIHYDTTASYQFDDFASKGLVDTQPDVFSFSFPGNSGKFFFDQNKTIHLMPHKSLKIEYTLNPNTYVMSSFTITDEHGNKFVFSDKEFTLTEASSCSGMSSGANTAITYYLSKIITTANEEIDYHYSTVSYSTQNQIGETRYWTSVDNEGGGDQACRALPNCTTTSTSSIIGLRLDNIENITTGEKVVFTYTNSRTDLPATKSLDRIDVFSSFSTVPLKTFSLTHDYFYSAPQGAATANNYRLRLTSIQQTGQQPYLFEYDNTPLPPRLCFAQDHWGYYNGELGNTTLLPNENTFYFSTGANRSPNPVYMKAGILTKITYPTGGSTLLDYETNDAYVDSYSTVYTDNSVSGVAFSNQTKIINFTVADQSLDFRVQWTTTSNDTQTGGYDPNGNNTTIQLSGPATNYFSGAVGFSGNSTGIVKLLSAGEQVSVLGPGTYTLTIANQNNTDQLPVGGIQIYWKTATNQHTIQNQLAGGMRIKTISGNLLNGTPTIQHFDYSNPDHPEQSSGKLLYPVIYDFDYYKEKAFSNSGTTYTLCPYIAQNSTTQTPIGSVQGQNVIYKNVAVYYGDKMQGYTLNEFITYGDGNTISPFSEPSVPAFPYPPMPTLDWLNGLPLKTTQFKYNPANQSYFPVSINQKIYKTRIGSGGSENFYSQANLPVNSHEYYVRGAKIIDQFPDVNGTNVVMQIPGAMAEKGDALTTGQFVVGYYYLYSSWYHLDQEINTVYDQNGQNPAMTTLNYFYDNPTHIQLTRTETTKSDSKTLASVTTYPDDYASGTTFLDDLKATHQIALPIEQVNYLTDGFNINVVNGTATQYKTGGRGWLDQIYKLETSSPIFQSSFKFSNSAAGQLPFNNPGSTYALDSHYYSRLTYNQYDDHGNPLQATPSNGLPAVYLWGYNSTYPIAEVRNASYQDVVTVLTQGTIDQLAANTSTNDSDVRNTLNVLRTDSRLKNAQVTTYTYNPLVGMTSQTDAKGLTTYYEYDSFQRLVNVKDYQGNILKHYDYHYQNQ